MVWIGIEHGECRWIEGCSLKDALRSSNSLPVFEITWMSNACTKAGGARLFKQLMQLLVNFVLPACSASHFFSKKAVGCRI